MHQALVIKQLLYRLRRVPLPGIAASAAVLPGEAFVGGPADAVAGAEPLKRILVLPMGDIVLRGHSKRARLDDLAHAEAVVAASLAHAGRTDPMIDYDHQSYHAVGPGKGGNARAAGWIKGLSADEAGIWADVEWTPAAAAALAAREYRYISPIFYPDKDGRVVWLRNAGLVNEPAIEALPAVAAAYLETPVNYTKIAAALGLPDTATEDEILAAIGAMAMPVPADKMAMAAAALHLPEAAGVAEIVLAAAAFDGTPDPAAFVASALYETVRAENAALKGKLHTDIIAAAIEAGKLTPAEQPWAASYIAKDEAGFQAMLVARTPVVAGGELDLGRKPAAGAALTDEEAAVCASLGITPDAFIAAKKD